MSSDKCTAHNKYSTKLTEPVESTIDLTEPVSEHRVECTDPAECLIDITRSLSEPCSVKEGGISFKKKKRKSGAADIWREIKKQQTSGKMKDKQMELANKLAQFEVVHDELEATKADASLAYLDKVPKPEWLEKPNERPSYTHVYEEKNGTKSTSASDQMAKITRLTECMKHMNIEVHPHLLRAWYLEELEANAAALGLRVIPASELCPGAIAMTRTMPRELVAGKAQSLQLSNLRRNSLRYLFIQCASEIAAHLARNDLTKYMAARKRILGGQITLLILDTQKYFKNGKPQLDLEAAIVDMIVTLEIDTLVMKSADALVSTIIQFTKAIAEEPAKLAKRAVDEQAEFYMRGDNKNCVTVDQQGNGLSRAWQQMLSVLPHSSLEVSRAIESHCATPRLMAEIVSTEEGTSSLANLGVTRSTVPGAKPRRLGNELAKRLTTLFTSLDGDQIVE